ncbi:cupredoxin family copper-binding protein [Pararhizobium sp. YC-54]|uniref:cupredoxin domain-containing protein n=1 Tax=Pararhizobium sp. YC-54 TaxID=2986920 RepID=UPI0021F72223|nr:cupredoxin family copper-binding protein [Pararhizobium sp. YC-54]MCW0000784.1 cupredoxin family copper-binding protein [Pararhizobium sp. YC-54]
MTRNLLNRRQLLITGAAVLSGHTLVRAHNGTVHVTIDKLAFLPAEIQIKAGETVEWTNKDRFAHTATVKGGWDVLIPPGKTATHVATVDDTVDYYCRFHPNMKGRIVISA